MSRTMDNVNDNVKDHVRLGSTLRGFTLIEILLGVLILGLGLLGLASVFPLVVKQQRESQDVVLGASAGKGAESVLRGHFTLNDPSGTKGWARLSNRLVLKANQQKGTPLVWSNVLNADGSSGLNIYGSITGTPGYTPEPGSMVFWGQAVSDVTNAVIIRTSDRLLPQGPGVTPQYVWDAVPLLARTPVNDQVPEFAPLRVAVFVRRIDPGIRLGANQTVQEAIAGGGVAAIALDRNFFPTFDGSLKDGGRYATFFALKASRAAKRYGLEDAPYTVVEFNNASDAESTALRQAGQQIVDSEGNIYTVAAIPSETGASYNVQKSVVITPPLPTEIVRVLPGGGGTSAKTVEFLVSPVLPASVDVIVIRR
ncbi:MAG: prepilin-type N-terminal cleavage/methylation domain-containing protein [Phycisphaerales bacterium]|nr:prepilin-type N-terminal cleavage/methylation domain-containing protein [Phycisphaerales bacterium]